MHSRRFPQLPAPRRPRPSRVPRPLRLAALAVALCLAWSLTLAVPVRAFMLTAHAAAPRNSVNALALLAGRARLLTPAGQETLQQANFCAEDAGGAAYPWQASVGGTNLTSGNKLTQLPLVSWAARGGLPVGLTLTHNSKGAASAELGPKWTQTYDITLSGTGGTGGGGTGGGGNGGGGFAAMDVSGEAGGGGSSGGLSVAWGDGSGYPFTQSGAAFTPPAGIHDALAQNADGTYALTKADQTRYHFTAAGQCDTISDENGNQVSIARNADGTVSAVTDPTGRALTFGYGGGLLRTVTDPLGRVWALAYDAAGELQGVTLPAVGGATYAVGYGYDAAHDITAVTDPRGSTRSLGYNGDGSLAWEQDAAGSRTSYAYSGATATVTDPNGNAAAYTYDTGGRVVQTRDAAGYSEYAAYDANNDKTQVEDKRGYYWRYTYDGMGNVLTAQDPAGDTTTSTYNSHNKLLTKALPGGESVANAYDASDDLTQTQQKNSAGTVLATTTYTVGGYGLVTAKTDPDGHGYGYGYDANGDLTSLTTPLGRQTQWGYDALGTKTSRTDALGRATSYTLDGWERTTAETYPDGTAKTFTYDADSDVTGFADPTGTTARTYDADGRLLTESKGGSTVVSHSYDASGQAGLLSSTTDARGRVLTYAYTGRDQLASVSEAAGTTSYAYDADGDETGITNGNGTTVAKVYDNAGRLSSVTNKAASGTVLSSFSYAYNADSLKTGVTEADGSQVAYGYDGLLHLSSEVRTGTAPYTASYVVDGAGDRQSQTTNGVTTTLTYDADDELLSTSGGFANSYGYNANGDQTTRTLSGTSYALSYDFDDQLTGTGGASFAYDAAGRRVARTAGGVTTSFLYDGDEVLLEQQGSTTTATYAYGNALTRKDGETPLFDGLGSERTVTNTSGAVQATLTLSAFGQALASSGSSSDPYQYAATSRYRNDGDAGLALVGCRYYDAQVGAFITRDTYLDQRPYAYCNGDPVNATDPSGHQGVSADGNLEAGLTFLAIAASGLFILVTLPITATAVTVITIFVVVEASIVVAGHFFEKAAQMNGGNL